jgi:glycosyltransferase involved in cell wall biosynthesis
VDTKDFRPNFKIRPARLGNYFLLVSRLEPYKKIDLVIEAFKKLKLPLKIVGSGTRYAEYRQAAPANVEFVGRVSDKQLVASYQQAIATVFPQEEDAGIVPLESMACGRPVIAFGRGGALESIIDGQTGIFFPEPTVSSLVEAVKRFQKLKFNPQLIRRHAEKFDKQLFKRKILKYIRSKVQKIL